MDRAYCERSNGRWECWTYSEGRTIMLICREEKYEVAAWCRHHGYELIWIC